MEPVTGTELPEWAPRLLAKLEAGTSMRKACPVIGVARRTVYNWAGISPEFAQAVTDATKAGKKSKEPSARSKRVSERLQIARVRAKAAADAVEKALPNQDGTTSAPVETDAPFLAPMTQTLPRAWRDTFLAAFAETGMVAPAAEQAGVSRTLIYSLRETDADFRERMDAAWRVGFGLLEDVAVKRGLQHSDKLLMFILQSGHRRQYNAKLDVTHGGNVGLSLFRDLSDDDLSRIAGAPVDGAEHAAD